MIGYREVHKCDNCGKVYRTDYFLSMRFNVCRKCGRCCLCRCIGKPKLFGLRGWEIIELKDASKKDMHGKDRK